jgi:hypothetical protein
VATTPTATAGVKASAIRRSTAPTSANSSVTCTPAWPRISVSWCPRECHDHLPQPRAGALRPDRRG